MENILNQNEIIENNEKVIANILHDVKSPLYSIKIALEAIKKNEIEEEILKTTLYTINYIETYLQNYKFKSGKFKKEITKIDILSLVKEKIENYKYILIDKNVIIDLFIEEDENFKINQFEIFISSILSNLISNIAFHASINKTAKIELYRKEDIICINFKNYYQEEIKTTNLGLDFTNELVKISNCRIKVAKTKHEMNISLKIPDLNYRY